jgi:opacity protein-like surface antigen
MASSVDAQTMSLPALADTFAKPEEPQFGVRAFGDAGVRTFTATKSFNAILDKANGPIFGGGVQITSRHGFFAQLAVSRFKQDGHRAFVLNGHAFNLGIPTTITITPVEAAFGYRFLGHRTVPYGAAGVGTYGYQERSKFDEPGEGVDARHTGFLALGGAEVRLIRWLALAGEGQYSRVTGILGTAGVSKDFNENDLGGFTARVKVIVGR